MAENSKIEWTHHTVNLWHGCTKVHAGCDHCYAETLSNRWGKNVWGNDAPRLIIRSAFAELIKYQKIAEEAGEIHRVFVGSMKDIFEKPMPLIDSKGNEISGQDTGFLRSLLFQHIDAGLYNNLLFLFLTKRPSNINKYIPESWKTNPPKNVMFGTSPCDQATYDNLYFQLSGVNGKRFLSIEPLLGPIDLDIWHSIDWVIVGGESGHGARPMHPDWVRSLRDQCKKENIPFFFKQWGEWKPYNTNPIIDPIPLTAISKKKKIFRDGGFVDVEDKASVEDVFKDFVSFNVGKKEAGRELDGIIYNEFPVIK